MCLLSHCYKIRIVVDQWVVVILLFFNCWINCIAAFFLDDKRRKRFHPFFIYRQWWRRWIIIAAALNHHHHHHYHYHRYEYPTTTLWTLWGTNRGSDWSTHTAITIKSNGMVKMNLPCRNSIKEMQNTIAFCVAVTFHHCSHFHWMRFFLKSEWMLFLISTRIFIISFNQSAHGAREARKKWGWRASESIWNEHHFEFDTRKNTSWTHK